MKRTLSTLVAALLLAMTGLPASHADPGGDDYETAAGNCYAEVKGLIVIGHLGLGAGTCTPAVFDVTSWNGDPGNTGVRQVTVWAEWTGGVFVSGFGIIACSDRNDDDFCSTPTGDDQAKTYSNDGLDGHCDKDQKDCGDPTDALLTLCIREDLDGSFDDLHVFVGDWADASLGGNIGTGVSHGEYDVWLTYGPWVDPEVGC